MLMYPLGYAQNAISLGLKLSEQKGKSNTAKNLFHNPANQAIKPSPARRS